MTIVYEGEVEHRIEGLPDGVVLRSVTVVGDGFRANREQNLAAIDKLQQLLARARAGGGEKYVARHVKRGKLLPRERVDLLLDRDSPFL